MTAQSSTRNRFFQYYMYRLGKLKNLMIILSFFGLMTFPLYSLLLERYAAAVTSPVDLENGSYLTYKNLCEDLGWKLFYAGVLCGVVVMLLILLEGFRYLHRKKFVNMDMALPLTHTERFFGDLLAVITAQFVPLLAMCGIGKFAAAHVRSFNYSQYYQTLEVPPPVRLCERMEAMIPQFIVAALMLLFISLFVISFCGRTPIAVMMTVFVQIAVPVITFTLWYISSCNAYGAAGASFGMDLSLFSLLSPFGYLMAAGYGDMHYLLNRSPWGYLFIAVYLAALCAGAYFLQKHRRAERTGEPFVYKYARHGFTALYILAATAFFSVRIMLPELAFNYGFYQLLGGSGTNMDSGIFIVLWIAVTLTILIVAELIGGGKPKQIPLTAARYVITTALSFGICAGALITEGYGYVTYIPSLIEADSAHINLNNGYDWLYFDVPYDKAAELHKRILEERPFADKNSPLTREDGVRLSIMYQNGDKYVTERVYNVDDSYVRDLYNMYFECGGFSRRYNREESSSYTYLNKDYRWETIELTPSLQYVYAFRNGDERIRTDIDVDELYSAMQADAAEVTFETLYLTSYSQPAYIHIYREIKYPNDVNTGIGSASVGDLDYPVYPFFKRTIALLEEHGIDLFTEKDYSASRPFIVKVGEDDIKGNTEVRLYNAGDYLKSSEIHRLSPDSPEFTELLGYCAEKSAYTGNERYFLAIYNPPGASEKTAAYYYPITEANTARAAEIWSDAPYADTETANLQAGFSIYGEEE